MGKLLAEDVAALRILMSEDLYKVTEPEVAAPVIQSAPDTTTGEEDLNRPASSQVIQSGDTTAPDQKAETPGFSYLGENNKYFLILVNDPKHQHLNTPDREVLLKILQAKGMELRDVAILNVNKLPLIRFQDLKSFFVPSRIVFFGLSPELFGIPSMSTNAPGKFENVNMLTTYNFDEMQADINKKKAFWQVMKNF
jgi:hypothetical protein